MHAWSQATVRLDGVERAAWIGGAVVYRCSDLDRVLASLITLAAAGITRRASSRG